MIRDVVPEDATAIAKIYNHYVEQTDVTFEMELVDSNEMQQRIKSVLAGGFPWLVKLDAAGEVVGYAYGGPWRARLLPTVTISGWPSAARLTEPCYLLKKPGLA